MAKKLTAVVDGAEQPLTMSSLIDDAKRDWEAGNKDQAFYSVLSALTLLSLGVRKCLNHVDEAELDKQPQQEKK